MNGLGTYITDARPARWCGSNIPSLLLQWMQTSARKTGSRLTIVSCRKQPVALPGIRIRRPAGQWTKYDYASHRIVFFPETLQKGRSLLNVREMRTSHVGKETPGAGRKRIHTELRLQGGDGDDDREWRPLRSVLQQVAVGEIIRLKTVGTRVTITASNMRR